MSLEVPVRFRVAFLEPSLPPPPPFLFFFASKNLDLTLVSLSDR